MLVPRRACLNNLGVIDIVILVGYGMVLLGMGAWFARRSRTPEGFMVAGRHIPAWAAGLAIVGSYTSSISYIATPGKAFDENWHPLIFALTIPPVAWIACRYAVPHYRRTGLISAYEFLETRLGAWARAYASLSFVLYMIGRTAVILYLASLLLTSLTRWRIEYLILSLGLITVLYTLMGGFEAVIWTDVVQSVIMVGGGLFCAFYLTYHLFQDPQPLLSLAVQQGKYSLGSSELSFSSRTIWVMIVYGVTENLRNLIADQNYVQKYAAATSESSARRSVWISAAVYIPLTVLFLYIGTSLYSFYSSDFHQLAPHIERGDEVFPYFIATELPPGLKGLIIAAILAAAMSTVDSALNCSATVTLLDFYRRYWDPGIGDVASVRFLRGATVFWGILGTGFAMMMLQARSALDVWWQVSGIFGGGILGLFLLALLRDRVRFWHGIAGITAGILTISWATFARGAAWWQTEIDAILAGALGTLSLLMVVLLLSRLQR